MHKTRLLPLVVLSLGCAAEHVAAPPPLPAGPVMAAAEPPTDEPDAEIDAALRAQVIELALDKLDAEYVFPDLARKMAAAVRARVKRHEYDAVKSALVLARLLTEHLQDVCHDKHVRVRYSAAVLPSGVNPDQSDDAAEVQRRERWARHNNHGFEKVERLGGNIGYLEMRSFMSPDTGGDTAAAAMTFLADTDALIVDLRRNGGGSPEMVALVTSYLFDAKSVHLNDLFWRSGKDGETQQFWTLPHVPGRRFGPAKPVYVLTSKDTFSAAEEFTYNLKSQKRATIVGEITRGGAHPGGQRRLTDHFSVWVPRGRAINPITKTNWEGTGVKPDVEVPAALALETAEVLILRDAIARAGEADLKDDLQRTLRAAEAELDRKKATR